MPPDCPGLLQLGGGRHALFLSDSPTLKLPDIRTIDDWQLYRSIVYLSQRLRVERIRITKLQSAISIPRFRLLCVVSCRITRRRCAVLYQSWRRVQKWCAENEKKSLGDLESPGTDGGLPIFHNVEVTWNNFREIADDMLDRRSYVAECAGAREWTKN